MNDATPIRDALMFCSGSGQYDTRAEVLSDGRPNPSPLAGTAYDGITAAQIVAMVADPPSRPKEEGRWFIPSTYREADARGHSVQRAGGTYYWLAVDVDSGSPTLQAVADAISTVLGDVSRLVYATRSATPELMKWRVLVPLARPLSGEDYADHQAAFFDLLATQGVECDRALVRPGQLIYLPNKGSWYQHEIHKAVRLRLLPSHPLTLRVTADRSARAAAEREAMASRAQRRARTCRPGEEESPSDWFNAQNDLESVLTRYGWTASPGGRDWRSPFQKSGSFATRIMGEGAERMWVSLSASDAGQGFGITTKTGAIAGDAFDLFTHFDHGGDTKSALKEVREEMRATIPPLGWSPESSSSNCHDEELRGASRPQDHSTGDSDSRTQERADSGSRAWPAPDTRLMGDVIAPAPALPLADVLTPSAADWVDAAAEGAGAPPDYVLLSLLSVVGATVGNSRWVTIWPGWSEPPVIWAMCVGNPSAGKSPAIDAVLAPLRRAERPLRDAMLAETEEWEKRAKVAKVAHAHWEKKVTEALAKDRPSPPLPPEADAGRAPHVPRLIVSDGTVERLGVIVEAQPKGFLQFRDELAGWLLGMEVRNGGSDRAFWLEAFGGRGFTVERMGRQPLTVDRLLIGVLGGIQPDRLSELLLKARDDGLLARFLPIWPNRLQPKRPERLASDALADTAMARLTGLDMVQDENGTLQPWFVEFNDEAKAMMDVWRNQCSEWEAETDGLLLSFIGKLPGIAARLALVLSAIAYAFDGAPDPGLKGITAAEFGRACHFLEEYAVPMARRAYGAASVSKGEHAARVLISAIVERGWRSFDTRVAMRDISRPVLGTAEKLAAALRILEEADIIRATKPTAKPAGGRPARIFEVNPAIWRNFA